MVLADVAIFDPVELHTRSPCTGHDRLADIDILDTMGAPGKFDARMADILDCTLDDSDVFELGLFVFC